MPRIVRGTKGKAPVRRLRSFQVGSGIKSVGDMCDELEDMRDVLMGRKDPAVTGVLALMETADAFYSRASEMEQLILRGEREGRIQRSNPLYRFRTGELRSFKEMAARAADLGSRRLTAANVQMGQEQRGRESYRG